VRESGVRRDRVAASRHRPPRLHYVTDALSAAGGTCQSGRRVEVRAPPSLLEKTLPPENAVFADVPSRAQAVPMFRSLAGPET
jgi:hypothetical protein